MGKFIVIMLLFALVTLLAIYTYQPRYDVEAKANAAAAQIQHTADSLR